MFMLTKRTAIVLIALALICGQPAKANELETFIIPPMDSDEANGATDNMVDVINTLRQAGFKKQANKFQELMDDGRLFYQWTGKRTSDNTAETEPAAKASDGKAKIRFGRYHVSGDAENFGRFDEPKRYSGYMGEVSKYMTAKTALHEFVHTERSLSEWRTGKHKQEVHEVEAYRRSLKQFADGILVDGLRDYLISKDGLSPDSQAHAIQQIRAIIHAFLQSLYVTDDDLGPVGGAGDKACRWKVIDRKLRDLFFKLEALEYDAKSHDECGQDGRLFTAQEKDVVTELKRVTDAKAILDGDLAELAKRLGKSQRQYDALFAELSDPQTTQKRRIEIAQRTGDIDRYLQTTRPRHDRLKEKSNTALQRQKILNRQLQSARNRKTKANRGYHQCRVNYITLALQQKKIDKSKLPPDMGLAKNGKVTLLPPNQQRVTDLEQEAAKIESMFNYDPDELSKADDPRTPCYPLNPNVTNVNNAPPKPTTPATPTKPASGTKTVCTGGGMLGTVNCVTIRMDNGN